MSEFLKDPIATLGLLTLLILVFGALILLIFWPFWRRRTLRQEATQYKGFVELDEQVFAVQEKSGVIRIKARRRSLTLALGFFVLIFGFGFLSFGANPSITTTSASSAPLGAIVILVMVLFIFVVSLLLPPITIDPQAQAIFVPGRQRTRSIPFSEVEKVFTEKLANGKILFKLRLSNGQDLPLGSLSAHQKAHEQRSQTFYKMLSETIKPSVQTSE